MADGSTWEMRQGEKGMKPYSKEDLALAKKKAEAAQAAGVMNTDSPPTAAAAKGNSRGNRGKQPRGNKTGERTDGGNQKAANPSNTGAFKPDISTRRPEILHRPPGASVEFGGVKYWGYNNAPIRQDRLQVLVEPRRFKLKGWIPVNQGTNIGRPDTIMPAAVSIDRLWDNAYDLLRQLAEDRDGYRHLPDDLNESDRLLDYCSLWVTTYALLKFLTCAQKLSSFDQGHLGTTAVRVSRGRTDEAWRALGSIPMFDGVVQLADYISTPIMGNPESPVYHPYIPFCVDDYAWGQTLTQLKAISGKRGDVFALNSSDLFTNVITTVEALLLVFNRTAPAMSADDKEDVQNIQSLFRMIGVPAHQFSWSEVSPLAVDPQRLDQVLYRNAWYGGADLTGTDQTEVFPARNSIRAFVEVRGLGAGPKAPDFMGWNGPMIALNGTERYDVTNQNTLIGLVAGGNTQSTNAPALGDDDIGFHRDITFFTPEDGWLSTPATSYTNTANEPASPLENHQYIRRSVGTAAATEMRVNDSVDYGFFMQAADIGAHQLAWTSQMLGIPYVGS